MKIMLALAAIVALAGSPAAGEPVTLAVSYADLDLASVEDMSRLDRRIVAAVAAACGTASDIDLAGQNEVRRCRITATADAAAAVRRLTPMLALR